MRSSRSSTGRPWPVGIDSRRCCRTTCRLEYSRRCCTTTGAGVCTEDTDHADYISDRRGDASHRRQHRVDWNTREKCKRGVRKPIGWRIKDPDTKRGWEEFTLRWSEDGSVKWPVADMNNIFARQARLVVHRRRGMRVQINRRKTTKARGSAPRAGRRARSVTYGMHDEYVRRGSTPSWRTFCRTYEVEVWKAEFGAMDAGFRRPREGRRLRRDRPHHSDGGNSIRTTRSFARGVQSRGTSGHLRSVRRASSQRPSTVVRRTRLWQRI